MSVFYVTGIQTSDGQGKRQKVPRETDAGNQGKRINRRTNTSEWVPDSREVKSIERKPAVENENLISAHAGLISISTRYKRLDGYDYKEVIREPDYDRHFLIHYRRSPQEMVLSFMIHGLWFSRMKMMKTTMDNTTESWGTFCNYSFIVNPKIPVVIIKACVSPMKKSPTYRRNTIIFTRAFSNFKKYKISRIHKCCFLMKKSNLEILILS